MENNYKPADEQIVPQDPTQQPDPVKEPSRQDPMRVEPFDSTKDMTPPPGIDTIGQTDQPDLGSDLGDRNQEAPIASEDDAELGTQTGGREKSAA